ncbi:chaperonin 10-like protein [Aspergillus avenaceus]|uniref:Chaperonin 10-like protein n=1 Tax=Aspergillus avenaceus TaxID=36643 RepID=A0A5N6U6T6_ASPAV|nr:chaperonin 10-like protein [Aspergillus avenaceus]
MNVTFDVFRGSPEGRIVADKTTRVLQPHEVYIKVTHSGLCGSDEHFLRTGQVLGHEGAGIVKHLGSAVTSVKVGDRVGFGFTHGSCGSCEDCLTGWDQYCPGQQQYGSHNLDNGTFSYHTVWAESHVFPIPENYDSAYAAPLMCGGATVWTPLTEYGVRSTDRVGVMGVGGLGHLAIKLASAMGCEVVVLSSSEGKRQEAMEYGAAEYHVLRSGERPPEECRAVKHLLLCGSANVDYSSLLPLMATHGTIYPLTVAHVPSPVPMLAMVHKGVRIQASLVASRQSIRTLLDFAAKKHVVPTINTFPMTVEGIEEAMQTLREGKMRYRGVLVCDQ